MNVGIWCKTLLAVYRYLQPLSVSIDRLVSKETLLNDHKNTLSHTNYIIELTDRKVDLINLKILIEDILLKIPKEHAKLLILKFYDDMTSIKIAELMDFNIRTYFRKLRLSFKNFERLLLIYLKQKENLFKKLLRQAWLLKVYNQFLTDDDSGNLFKLDDICKNNITKTFLTDVKANI